MVKHKIAIVCPIEEDSEFWTYISNSYAYNWERTNIILEPMIIVLPVIYMLMHVMQCPDFLGMLKTTGRIDLQRGCFSFSLE